MQGLYTTWDTPLYERYLDDFHLPARQKLRHFSRGMTMKLAMAAALAHHPQLLILDEATSGVADYITFIHQTFPLTVEIFKRKEY